MSSIPGAVINRFAQAGVPLFLDNSLRPCLRLGQGANPHPTVICSIPKSGTYFFAALLEALGVVSCDVHVADASFVDCRFASTQEVRTRPMRWTFQIPSTDVLPLVQPGQFVVGHLACNPSNESLLSTFRVLFIYRNVRDALVSYMRYVTKNWLAGESGQEWAGMPDGPTKMEQFLPAHAYYLAMCANMVPWKQRSNVLSCSYEELMGDHGEQVQRDRLDSIVTFLGLPPSTDPKQALEQVVGRDTLTFSGSRSTWRSCWSDLVERQFIRGGGDQINRQFGYPEA